MNPERRIYLRNLLLMSGLTLLFLEGSSRALLRLADSRLEEQILAPSDVYQDQTHRIDQLFFSGQRHLLVLDTVLGWRYQPNWSDSTTRLNAEDLRSDREYSPAPLPGHRRVALFGDSFVYGNEVSLANSWSRLVEQDDSSLEVLNYGVGGFGDDQAYLRYLQDGTALKPDIAVLGFTTDDLSRLVNVYRRFRSTAEAPVFKPRFRLTAGKLDLIPTPVRSLEQYHRLHDDPASVVQYGVNDQWFEPLVYRNPLYQYSATARMGSEVWIRLRKRYFDPQRMFSGNLVNTGSDAFKIQVAIFQAFHDLAIERHQVPLILFLPEKTSLGLSRAGAPPLYQPLISALRAGNIAFLDGQNAFSGDSTRLDGLFMPGGHYSPTANQLVARWLTVELERLSLPASP